MKCKNCGYENMDEANFCINCGTKIEKMNQTLMIKFLWI